MNPQRTSYLAGVLISLTAMSLGFAWGMWRLAVAACLERGGRSVDLACELADSSQSLLSLVPLGVAIPVLVVLVFGAFSSLRFARRVGASSPPRGT